MLQVKNLSKSYPGFSLKNVSFGLEEGYIAGFIGRNGAGKTTTLKSMLNLVRPDSGEVEIFGLDIKKAESEIKQELAFMTGTFDYYPQTKIGVIAGVYKRFYKNWDDSIFKDYLGKFSLDPNKRVKELSAGMKVKFGLALALSHKAKLLILDEPTSGLDPVARNEVMNVFRRIIENGARSILFSTHITSDLDKCADYIIFIKDGEIIADETRDDLIEKHIVVKGALELLTEDFRKKLVGCETNRHGFSALMKRADYSPINGLKTETPNLEDIMIYYNEKEEL